MYTHVVFDLDGTLLDTLQDLAAAGNHALSAMVLPTHPLEAYRFMVGNGIPTLVERMLPQNNRGVATQELALRLFSQYYTVHKSDLTLPYPGILPMLKNLQKANIQMAVASNKKDDFVRDLVAELFPGIFHHVVGLRDGVPAKPDPACVITLLAEMGAAPADTLYVGDTDVDMKTAKNANLVSCGVLWGFRPKEELLASGADFLAKDAAQLQEIIMCRHLT